MDDTELLKAYAQRGDRAAFAQLVERHAGWLHSAALRIVRNPAMAADVTQAVFVALSKKAGAAARQPLMPWLFRVLHYVSSHALRAEARRRKHERKAAAMRSEITDAEAEAWKEIAPVLEELVEKLGSEDRHAVLLRFYQRASFTEVGAALGVGEEAARKRVTRAVEKLRGLMLRRGVVVPGVLLAGVLWSQAASAAPTVVLAAAAGGAAAAPVLALAKGGMQMLLVAKLKAIGAVAAGVAVAAGTVVVVHQTQAHAPMLAPVAQTTPAPAATAEAPNREEAARAALAARGAAPARGPTAADLAARERFLRVERFARIPIERQAAEYADFYKNVAPAHISDMALGIMSSIPDDILNRMASGPRIGDTQVRWAGQLEAAAATMTEEQVADNLATNMWYNAAAYIRTRQILAKHPSLLFELIDKDIASDPLPDVQRGLRMIQEMKLTSFTPKVLAIYLGPVPARVEAARTTLIWLRDPLIVTTLLEDIAKDPVKLQRHSGLFQGPLAGQPVEPALLAYLDSPDAEMRYHAAYALCECRDPALAKAAARLSKEEGEKRWSLGFLMVARLSPEAFAGVRPELVDLLASPDRGVRVAAISCFAKQKDLAAGRPLMEFLKMDAIDSREQVPLMQALSALADSNFQYFPHQWGPARNAPAIAAFENWLTARGQ